MKRNLLLLIILLLTNFVIHAQFLYDNEDDGTVVTWTHFGSTLEGTNAEIIDNPNPTGINTSAKVASFVKAADGQPWAGAYANPLPLPVNTAMGTTICVDVHFDHIGNMALKIENSTDGGTNWVDTVKNTVVNEWETICFDLTKNSIEDPFLPASNTYPGMVVFFDFQSVVGEDVTFYFDNIRMDAMSQCNTIYDFEEDGQSTSFLWFGNNDLNNTEAGIIDNPNPTGINESAKVTELVKTANSEVWAGVYASPQPIIDLSSGGKICIDVHYDHIGNIAIKLEQSPNGGMNWIDTVQNTVINEWEQICVDVSNPSIEDPFLPAEGFTYGQIVLFPDFQSSIDMDRTFYVDNICYEGVVSNETHDVTFQVDLNEQAGTFTTAYLSGSFNGWSPDANPMTDDDGDNIWETTITGLPVGAIEYKFQLDQWANQDFLEAADECVAVTDDGMGNVFINRLYTVTETTTLDPVCLNSCYACGQEALITWNVNMNNEDVSDDGVYIAGGPFFGHAELPAMTDEDGDGIYTTTLRRFIGFETDYTILNGICLPNWECKENIAGQDCAVPPFNDRHVGPLTESVVINTCFGECSETTECTGGPASYEATFQVDMNGTTVGAEGVFVAGALINNWDPTATPLSDDDGDGIYSVTVELIPGVIEYKFINGTAWENLVEDSCTINIGGYINRVFTMEEKDTTLMAHLFESCAVMVSNNETIEDNLFSLQPNLTNGLTTVVTEINDPKVIEVYDLNGRRIIQRNMAAYETNLSLDMSSFDAGMYIVTLRTENRISTKRLIVN